MSLDHYFQVDHKYTVENYRLTPETLNDPNNDSGGALATAAHFSLFKSSQ